MLILQKKKKICGSVLLLKKNIQGRVRLLHVFPFILTYP
jgi:hypothetical protein